MAAKKVSLVVVEVKDRPGALAETLVPIAKAGVNLLGVVGHSCGGGCAEIVCAPDCVDTAMAALKEAGIKARKAEGVIVTGPDAVGVGARMAKRAAAAKINLKGVAALSLKGRYECLVWVSPKDSAALAAGLKAK